MKYTVTVTVNGEDNVETYETKDEVKEILQTVNSAKSSGVLPEVTVVDEDGKQMEPHEFGLPKPKKFESKLANAIDKVNETEGSREAFEWLLEHVAMNRYDAWDISEALDEVFGGDSVDIATMDKANFDISDEQREKDKIKVIDNNFQVAETEEEDLIDSLSEVIEEDQKDDFLEALKARKNRKTKVEVQE